VSGFVAIFHADGSAVDASLVRRMTDFLGFRGPDAQQQWCEGPIGLGHALLRTIPEAKNEHEPMSLDGHTWIVADARVDAREELIDALAHERGAGPTPSRCATDAELILRAYLLWGESCTEHLLGDFAFVIWDGRARRVFAARDHFGVKPLFYAETGQGLLLSSALDCLRLHPSVSRRLNERFVGDFLLTGLPHDPAITVFADVHRLPAAHALLCTADGNLRLSRYWTLPIEEPLRYQRPSEYIDEFRTLLRMAVRDRLRSERVSISLSGGLDSAAVAATACSFFDGDEVPKAVRALNVVYDEIIPDRERHFSDIVASYLGFPIEHVVGDEYQLFAGCEEGLLGDPEPGDFALELAYRDCFAKAIAHGRVLLTGQGGDTGLIPSLSYYRGWGLPTFVRDVTGYMFSHKRLPRIGFRLTVNRWLGKPQREPSSYPAWFQQDFERRAQLRDRWRELNQDPAPIHPHRPAAYANLCSPFWSFAFDYYGGRKPQGTIETRHPLFDLRLMRFFLRLPTLPWCADKELLRIGLRGALPDEILQRPKAPVPGDPIRQLLSRPESRRLEDFVPEPELREYVVRERIPKVTIDGGSKTLYSDLLPFSMNYWLRQQYGLGYTKA
jgi:asparagine synthase (glutamine-hydrolysing)